ncbi:hypothetical protein D3C83_01550 [compost metagenome]
MPHVGVERLRAGEREQHGAQHDEGGEAVLRREAERVDRVERLQHRRVEGDVVEADRRQREEPEHADRAEQRAHGRRALALEQEQRDQHAGRDRHDVGFEGAGADLQALHRGQHRDGGRQHGVAEEERRAQQPERDDERAAARVVLHSRRGERGQRHDPALAAVVGAHDQQHVLEGHHDHQRPEDRGQPAENVGGGERDAVRGVEGFLDGVERAGADVAENDAEREERQRGAGLPDRRTAGHHLPPVTGRARTLRLRCGKIKSVCINKATEL